MPLVDEAVPGSNKLIPVSVTNFDSVVSMQFVIRWNPEVLKYLTIDRFGVLPSFTISNFNAQHALDSGYVKMMWEAPNSFPGVSVIDTTIFRLRFNVVGADTSSSHIYFTEIVNSFPAIEFEVVQVAGPDSSLVAHGLEDCSLQNGFVAVGYTVATNEPDGGNIKGLSISPNPFSESTHIEYNLEQKADVKALVSDATGRVLFQKTILDNPAGNHQLTLDKTLFPAKGAYFFTIQTGSQNLTRSMICN